MTHRILIVDNNEAFTTMLQEVLQEQGNLQISAVGSGREALLATATGEYDLVIVDLGLPDVEPTLLVRTLRHEHPRLRLAVIPLEGEAIPPELSDVDLQGAIPKPCFIPELPGRIRTLLSRPVGGGPAPAEAPVVAQEKLPEVARLMSRLAQEVGAEAVLLTREKETISWTGRLPEEEVRALADVVSESWHTSARVAQILGREQLRFEQSIEGAEHLLYSLALAGGVILSIVISGRVALGMIRHRAKETAEQIRELMGL